MMYKKDFVAVIKCNGQILREIEDIVTLPFGSEYSILLKNLNSRKAQVSIQIDGKDTLDNKKLVIDGNKEVELKGYMNGFSAKNRFKFIQKTKEISEYRGDRIDDGIVRIEYQFEKKTVTQRVRTEYSNYHSYDYGNPIIIYDNYYTPNPDFTGDINIYCGNDKGLNIEDGNNISVFYSNCSDIQASNCSDVPRSIRKHSNISHKYSGEYMGFMDAPIPLEDEGITVKGSQCDQKFREVFMGELEEQSSVITLKIRGYAGKHKLVSKPMTVKTKIQCETCGRVSKSSAKFCNNCGTSLI